MEAVALIPLNPPAAATDARGAAWSGSSLLKYWHLASLDAPTVAVTWAYGFAWAAHVRLTLAAAVPLGLLVWVIYIADRLMDVRASLRQPGPSRLQERHWFHWRHRHVLGALAVLAGLAAAWLVAGHVPVRALQRDSLMAMAALAYFSGVHGHGAQPGRIRRLKARAGRLRGSQRVISRELLVAAIFSAGCVLPVLPMAPASLPRTYVALAGPVVAFAALAWLNLSAIELWESLRGDLAKPTLAASAAFLLGAVVLVSPQPRAAMLLLAAMASALLLACLDEMREGLDRVTLRAAADVVLLTPLVLLVADRLVGR